MGRSFTTKKVTLEVPAGLREALARLADVAGAQAAMSERQVWCECLRRGIHSVAADLADLEARTITAFPMAQFRRGSTTDAEVEGEEIGGAPPPRKPRAEPPPKSAPPPRIKSVPQPVPQEDPDPRQTSIAVTDDVPLSVPEEGLEVECRECRQTHRAQRQSFTDQGITTQVAAYRQWICEACSGSSQKDVDASKP